MAEVLYILDHAVFEGYEYLARAILVIQPVDLVVFHLNLSKVFRFRLINNNDGYPDHSGLRPVGQPPANALRANRYQSHSVDKTEGDDTVAIRMVLSSVGPSSSHLPQMLAF